MLSYFQNKRVLVTGAAGFIGSLLVEKLLGLGEGMRPVEVVAFDHDEGGAFRLLRRYEGESRVQVVLGDVRDYRKVRAVCEHIDIVLHAAALKHVSFCETSPTDAVATNILGLQNVIEAAREARVDTVLFTSSDKAVNPTNVMGTSKLMGERLISAANHTQRGKGPVYASCRFCNVIGSEGLVTDVFRRQIQAGGPVTVTDPDTVRFFMGPDETSRAILEAAALSRGGEVLVPVAKAVRIGDLADAMIEASSERAEAHGGLCQVEQTGLRPGEKSIEYLVSEEEGRRTLFFEGFYSVLPAFRGFYREIEYRYPGCDGVAISRPYRADESPQLSRTELRELLAGEEGGFHKGSSVSCHGIRTAHWPGEADGLQGGNLRSGMTVAEQ